METPPPWRTPPRASTLAAGEVHAWRVGLGPEGRDIAPRAAALSDEERARAARFRGADDRTRFVAAHAALRSILGRYAGCPPEAIAFDLGPHGKPGLAVPSGTGIAFNLSHSGGLAVVAVARGRRVGVDVEAVRPMAERDAIVARFLSPRERADFAGLSDPLRQDAFFRAWTCKEAYIKAIGTGLATPLDGFSVAVDPGEPMRLIEVVGDPEEATRWSIADLEPGPGYAGAVVAEGPRWEMLRYTYEPDGS